MTAELTSSFSLCNLSARALINEFNYSTLLIFNKFPHPIFFHQLKL